MIVGIGVDIVERSRMERFLAEHGPVALREMFTEAERTALRRDQTDDDPSRNTFSAEQIAYLGSRFAAKEAIFKVLETLPFTETSFRQIDVAGSTELRVSLSGRAADVASGRGIRTLRGSAYRTDDAIIVFIVGET